MNRIHEVLTQLHILRKKQPETPVSSGVMLVVAAGLLVAVLTFYGFLFSRYQSQIDEVLPAEKTLAYLSFEDLDLPPKLNGNPLFQISQLTSTLKTLTGFELPTPLPGFMKGPYGLAVLRVGERQDKTVLMTGIRSKRQAVKYFESLLMPGETLTKFKGTGKTIYAFPEGRPLAFAILNATLFIADSTEPLELLSATVKTDGSSLKDDPTYQKSASNLPRSGWGYAFIHFKALDLPEGEPISALLAPLQSMVNHVTFAIRKDHNGLLINQYLNLNDSLLSLNHTGEDRVKFTHDLSSLLHGETTGLYLGGANLAAEWQNTLETIAGLNPSYALILEAALRAQLEKIFGQNVDLRNDLYPLFEGEYAFGIGDLKDGNLAMKLLLTHKDREFVEIKMKKMMEGFRLLAAQFTPRIEVFTLPDGTETRELFADPESVKEATTEYGDADISCLEVEDSPYGFCYAVTENLLIMANKMSEVKTSLDLRASKGYSLSDNQSFRQPLSNLSKVNDEIGYFEGSTISDLFRSSPWTPFVQSALDPVESMTWVKHYFDDGMSLEGYILLK